MKKKRMRVLAVLGLIIFSFSCTSTEKADVDSRFETVTNSIGMKLVKIPAGEFLMGAHIPASEMSKKYNRSEKTFHSHYPQHKVRITKDFYMGTTEVTRGQFKVFVAETNYQTFAEKVGWSYALNGDKWEIVQGRTWKITGFPQEDSHPVVSLAYPDIIDFCRWLSEKEGKTYRLPTEAEWEYACRAGTQTEYHWGDSDDDAEGYCNGADLTAKEVFPNWPVYNWRDNYVYTSPVGIFKPNPFGLYDMYGNLWEWCQDWAGDKYYANSPVDDPQGLEDGGENPHRALRGGSWSSEIWRGHSAGRDASGEDGQGEDMGFRVVLEIAE